MASVGRLQSGYYDDAQEFDSFLESKIKTTYFNAIDVAAYSIFGAAKLGGGPYFKSRGGGNNRDTSPNSILAVGLSWIPVVGVCAATGYCAYSYNCFAEKLKDDVTRSFKQMNERNINEIASEIEEIRKRVDRSWYSYVARHRAPNVIGVMLMLEGLVEDSKAFNGWGNEFFNKAQNLYQRALTYEIEDYWRDAIFYVYGRSLRLSRDSTEAKNKFKNIGVRSPFIELAEFENQAESSSDAEVFSQGRIPKSLENQAHRTSSTMFAWRCTKLIVQPWGE